MPIISFSISEGLRAFLKRMVAGQEYKNNSNVIRDALVRLMNDTQDADVDSKDLADFDKIFPDITGSLLISLDVGNIKVERKINKIEFNYHDTILNKHTFTYDGIKTMSYVLKNSMAVIQNFISEINAVEEITSFRYIINEVKDE